MQSLKYFSRLNRKLQSPVTPGKSFQRTRSHRNIPQSLLRGLTVNYNCSVVTNSSDSTVLNLRKEARLCFRVLTPSGTSTPAMIQLESTTNQTACSLLHGSKTLKPFWNLAFPPGRSLPWYTTPLARPPATTMRKRKWLVDIQHLVRSSQSKQFCGNISNRKIS